MAYPAGVITRPVTFGPAFELEDGGTVGMAVSFAATKKGMLWRATGQPAVSVPITRTADDGTEGVLQIPVTDQTGWGDGDGSAIDPGDDGNTHLYAVSVVFTQGGRTIPGVQPRSKVVAIPQGDLSPLDLDDLIPMTSPGGTVVAVPDIWSAQIAAAEAAALEAANALIDSETFVADQVENGPAAAKVSAKIQRAKVPDTLITYDDDGNVDTVTENGLTTTYTYNVDGTVATDSVTIAGETINRSYTYDGDGNLTEIEAA